MKSYQISDVSFQQTQVNYVVFYLDRVVSLSPTSQTKQTDVGQDYDIRYTVPASEAAEIDACDKY